MLFERKFAIGVDCGTNGVRAIIVDLEDGKEISTAVENYPGGEAGVMLDPKQPLLARQNPKDYVDGFCHVVFKAIQPFTNSFTSSIGNFTTLSASKATRKISTTS